MNRIDRIFAEFRAAGRRGLMPFICAGYPELGGPAGLGATLRAIERAGGGSSGAVGHPEGRVGHACIAEIGIPFSDPVADGPVIAAAMHDALGRGVTPEAVFKEVGAVRDSLAMGLVAMVSVSIVWRIGPQTIVSMARRAGIDGFIIPDLPPDQGTDLLQQIRDSGLTGSVLVAPNTTPERAAELVKHCTGFVYLLARAGVTGEAAGPMGGGLGPRVRMLRGLTDLPIACGFGIATADDVRQVTKGPEGADAAIVGSALVKRMGRAGAAGDAAEEASVFVSELVKGLS